MIYPQISMNIHEAAVRLGAHPNGTRWLEIDYDGAPRVRVNVFLTPEALDNLEMTINELRAEEELRRAMHVNNGHVTEADIPF